MKYYWEYDYYDRYEDDDSDYGLICQDPKNTQAVTDVSMLRHYINCWGWTKTLKRHVNPLTYDQVVEIVDLCKGSTSIKSLKKDYDNIIKEANDIRIAQAEREMNNYILIEQLHSVRNNFCGLDTRNIKLMLNKIGKTNPVALAIRYLLEAEDYNIKAKESYGEYRDKNYEKKSEFVEKALDVCLENNFKCGWQDSDLPNISHVVYFDIPGVEQISFHQDLSSEYLERCPEYDSEWDSLVNSTLPKIEKAIKKLYSKEVETKKASLVKSRENAKKQKIAKEIKLKKEKEEAERIRKENLRLEKEEKEKLFNTINSHDIIIKKLSLFKKKTKDKNMYDAYIPVHLNEDGVLFDEKTQTRYDFCLDFNSRLKIYSNQWEVDYSKVKEFCQFKRCYELFYYDTKEPINHFKYELDPVRLENEEKERKREEIKKLRRKVRLEYEARCNAKTYIAYWEHICSQIKDAAENKKYIIVYSNGQNGWFEYKKNPKKRCKIVLDENYNIVTSDDKMDESEILYGNMSVKASSLKITDRLPNIKQNESEKLISKWKEIRNIE